MLKKKVRASIICTLRIIVNEGVKSKIELYFRPAKDEFLQNSPIVAIVVSLVKLKQVTYQHTIHSERIFSVAGDFVVVK